MDKKRKVDSIEEEKEEEEGDILPHSDLITPQEILSIFEADDYKRLQENIEKGLIKNDDFSADEQSNFAVALFRIFTSAHRKSLLMEACEAGAIECVKVLLANNFEVNYMDDNAETALSSAVKSGNIEIVNLLLTRSGFDLDLVYDTIHDHLYAPPSGFKLSTEIAKLLISRLPDVNRRILGGHVLLNQAAFHGHIDIVRLLLDSGADPTVNDHGGGDALYVASMEGHLGIVKLIFESDSPPKPTAASINKASLCACSENHTEVVRYLISKGADVNALDDDHRFGIDYAIRRNNIPLAKLLIESGFNVNAVRLNRSELFLACAQKRTELVQMLLDSSADPDLRYPDGSTLLLELVQDTCEKLADNTPYITLLLDRDANVNIAHERTGQTALMIAGAAANADLARLLLEHGADVTQVNREGKSVLDMVGRTRSHAKVAELCQAYIDSNRVDSKVILK